MRTQLIDKQPPRFEAAKKRQPSLRHDLAIGKTRRTGAAAVEFAIVAPIVFMMMLAIFQFAGLLMSQNVLSAAAREGARYASLPQAISADDVIEMVEERLRFGGVDPSFVDVVVEPNSMNELESGDLVKVSVSGPMNQMVWIGPLFPSGLNLNADFSCKRE